VGCWVGIRTSEGFLKQNAEENKNKEVLETLRKLHNEELQKLYISTNVIRVFKSRWMRQVEHGACMM
jgi:hypothetical protein